MAVVTCAAMPDLDPDDRLLLEPLAGAGVTVEIPVWDDPAVDWASYDLVVLRNPWDYSRRRDEFVAWAQTVPRLANPADVVGWNTDKRYLDELARAGVPIVPTEWVAPSTAPRDGDAEWTLPATGEWVIKPAVSAGSVDTGRYDPRVPEHVALAAAHVRRLRDAGRLVMVQPYLPAVDTYGETALMYFRGEYSHSIRKGPMLQGPDLGVKGLFKEEHITPRQPTEAEFAVAALALAAIPGGTDRLLYARVDLIADEAGHPVVVEVELTEPSLFLGTSERAAQCLTDAITAGLTVVR